MPPTPFRILEALKWAGLADGRKFPGALGIPRSLGWHFRNALTPPGLPPHGLKVYEAQRDEAYRRLGLLTCVDQPYKAPVGPRWLSPALQSLIYRGLCVNCEAPRTTCKCHHAG